MMRTILLAALASVAGLAFAFEDGAAYRQLRGAAGAKEGPVASLEAASARAGEAFDEPLNPKLFEAPKRRAPKAETAQAPRLVPSGDFVVGRPHDMREPKNPLTRENKPKEKGGGFWTKLIGAALGGLICGVIGFFAGGPVGAAVGFAAGAVGGWMVTR